MVTFYMPLSEMKSSETVLYKSKCRFPHGFSHFQWSLVYIPYFIFLPSHISIHNIWFIWSQFVFLDCVYCFLGVWLCLHGGRCQVGMHRGSWMLLQALCKISLDMLLQSCLKKHTWNSQSPLLEAWCSLNKMGRSFLVFHMNLCSSGLLRQLRNGNVS